MLMPGGGDIKLQGGDGAAAMEGGGGGGRGGGGDVNVRPSAVPTCWRGGEELLLQWAVV